MKNETETSDPSDPPSPVRLTQHVLLQPLLHLLDPRPIDPRILQVRKRSLHFAQHERPPVDVQNRLLAHVVPQRAAGGVRATPDLVEDVANAGGGRDCNAIYWEVADLPDGGAESVSNRKEPRRLTFQKGGGKRRIRAGSRRHILGGRRPARRGRKDCS